jgi:hypothetical protein
MANQLNISNSHQHVVSKLFNFDYRLERWLHLINLLVFDLFLLRTELLETVD